MESITGIKANWKAYQTKSQIMKLISYYPNLYGTQPPKKGEKLTIVYPGGYTTITLTNKKTTDKKSFLYIVLAYGTNNQ